MTATSRRIRLVSVAGWISVLGACGDGGTEPGSPPATLVAVSMPSDTVVIGELADPPLSVRVEDALGNAIEGTPVRFSLESGDGTVTPNVAVSGIDGIAEASYRAATSPGEAVVLVEVPSAPNLEAVRFIILAEPSDSILLRVVEGDEQRAEVGSQLPLPFSLRAETPAGLPAGGVAIEFEITTGAGQSAVLTSRAGATTSDGSASTLLTLGRGSGEYVVSAYATGGVLSDTIRFRATATATFEGSVLFDSIGAGGLVAGEQAVLHGSGFSPIAAENEVRIEGSGAEVLSATGRSLTILVPAFAGSCLPVREVGVRVLVAGDASNGRSLTLTPAEPVIDLATGESITVRGPEATSCVQLAPGDESRDYLIAVGSTDRRVGESVDMRISTRLASRRDVGGVVASLAPPNLDPAVEEASLQSHRRDYILRRSALEELIRTKAGVANASGGSRPGAIPVVGDAVEVRFGVGSGLVATCDENVGMVSGTVRAVGSHLTLVEDDNAPSGGFGPEEWEALLEELDGVVAPADTAYFGAYGDLDGNGRVLVFFTPLVNTLTGPSERGIGGFFNPIDLAASGRGGDEVSGTDRATCPASNEAEILYLAAADPDGTTGIPLGVDLAVRSARGVVAHELQHLINAQTRVRAGGSGFSAVEDTWLDEALSSVAEEIAGLAVMRQTTGGNLTYGQVANSSEDTEAFEAYHAGNFLALAHYLRDPGAAAPISDAPGALDGIGRQGFGWAFLRWVGDQSPGDERSVFRSLISGGQNRLRGIDNVEQATGRSWSDLHSDFSIAVATDNTAVEELDQRFGLSTWQLRDVFAALNRSRRSAFPDAFPLRTDSLSGETDAVDFDVSASTIRYFTVTPGSEASALVLSTPEGTWLSETSEPQITIVRNR